MILTLVDKLIARIIQLSKIRSENKRNIFINHVEPIFRAYEEIRENYNSSFRRFDQQLVDPNEPLSAILNQIKTELMYTEDKRITLRELCNHPVDERIGPFCYKVWNFITSPYSDYHHTQRWYTGLCNAFEEINNFAQFVETLSGSVGGECVDAWRHQRSIDRILPSISELDKIRGSGIEWIEDEASYEYYVISKNEHLDIAYEVLKKNAGQARNAARDVIKRHMQSMLRLHELICENYAVLRREFY